MTTAQDKEDIHHLWESYTSPRWYQWVFFKIFFPGTIGAVLRKLPKNQSSYSEQDISSILVAFKSSTSIFKRFFSCLNIFAKSQLVQRVADSSFEEEKKASREEGESRREDAPEQEQQQEQEQEHKQQQGQQEPTSAFSSSSTDPDLQTLLNHVARGEQDEAETLLRKKPHLLIQKGTVDDKGYGKRVFDDISAWQYMLWALDTRYMGKMMLSCIPKTKEFQGLIETLIQQYDEVKNKGVRYNGLNSASSSKEYNFYVILELENFINKFESKGREAGLSYWEHYINASQKGCPIHILQHYSDPHTSFAHPDFRAPHFERSLTNTFGVSLVDFDASEQSRIKGGPLLTSQEPGDKSKMCVSMPHYRFSDETQPLKEAQTDIAALKKLREVRREDALALKWELQGMLEEAKKTEAAPAADIIPPGSAHHPEAFFTAPREANVQTLLDAITATNKSKAKALLSTSPELLMKQGDFTDKQGRTFKNVSVWQYMLSDFDLTDIQDDGVLSGIADNIQWIPTLIQQCEDAQNNGISFTCDDATLGRFTDLKLDSELFSALQASLSHRPGLDS